MGCEGYENIILQLRIHDFFFYFLHKFIGRVYTWQ